MFGYLILFSLLYQCSILLLSWLFVQGLLFLSVYNIGQSHPIEDFFKIHKAQVSRVVKLDGFFHSLAHYKNSICCGTIFSEALLFSRFYVFKKFN